MEAKTAKNPTTKAVLGEAELKKIAKNRVAAWCNKNTEAKYRVADIYVVWQCYILGNWKAMLSTNHSGDGLYFEVTYNKQKKELYVDAYYKADNETVKVVK